jgi:hypothetical protein
MRTWEVFLFIFASGFTCLKFYSMGPPPSPKDVVLRIFIALKNPLPRPGLNPEALSPVGSTLSTMPPRRLILYDACKTQTNNSF